jgi:predicted RNA-binding protein with PIN domain
VSRYLIIDGYNVISKIEELEAKKDISLKLARLHFIRILKDFMTQRNMFDKIFIVFDSKEKGLGVTRDSYGSVEAIFATHEKDADSVIVGILRKASPSDKIKVCSDDNFVRNHAKVYSRTIISVKELENLIMLKNKTPGSKIKEKDLEGRKIRDINEELKKQWGLE